jgi:hypothetical protein
MIAGKYRTKRNGGIEYMYQVDWTVFGSQANWTAKVRQGGEYAGAPGGSIFNISGLRDVGEQVRRMVENAIEVRAGVR